MKPIRLIVSSCLLGNQVRYDAKSKTDNYICEQLGRAFELIGVCPEFESGLGVPREAIKLCGSAAAPEVRGVISNNDRTAALRGWLTERLPELAALEPAGFVLKNNEDLAVLEQLDDEEAPHECHCGGHCGGHHHG